MHTIAMNEKIDHVSIEHYLFYYSFSYTRLIFSLLEENRYIRSKIRLFDLTHLNSCLMQNMIINTDYVDASLK